MTLMVLIFQSNLHSHLVVQLIRCIRSLNVSDIEWHTLVIKTSKCVHQVSRHDVFDVVLICICKFDCLHIIIDRMKRTRNVFLRNRALCSIHILDILERHILNLDFFLTLTHCSITRSTDRLRRNCSSLHNLIYALNKFLIVIQIHFGFGFHIVCSCFSFSRRACIRCRSFDFS